MENLVQDQLIGSVVVARAVSSFANYTINKNVVFKRKCSAKKALFRYYMLAVCIMMASYGLIKLFSDVLGLNLYLAKVIADVILYTVSFFVQREFVYKK
jgi:putative flippase GtrA